MADHNQVTFHDALGELLRTSEKQQQHKFPWPNVWFWSEHSDLPKVSPVF